MKIRENCLNRLLISYSKWIAMTLVCDGLIFIFCLVSMRKDLHKHRWLVVPPQESGLSYLVAEPQL